MYGLCYVYDLISNIRMFILDGYHGNRKSYLIKPMLSNTLNSLAGVYEKLSYNKVKRVKLFLPILP